MLARDLCKCYGDFLAVNHLNFAVQAAHCFGLLGVNGAGKTSTFQMLTGLNLISAGTAFAAGKNLKRSARKVSLVYLLE